MQESVRKLLDGLDDPVGCEVPGGNWSRFPYATLAESVTRIQALLREELELAFDRDGNVQDASFHDELRILHPNSFRANSVVALAPEIAVRFSNFGRLYTIHSSFPDLLTKYPVDAIRALVERHGWVYVAADELDDVYDGKNQLLRDGTNTWWIRFFDYL